MKYDEFAFFNQQLAALLRDGIPLEGALRRLCEEMRAGTLRTELMELGDELSEGKPMAEALQARQLPELYKRMVAVGVKSGDLPGVLTMLADYFQRQSNIWMRLKGMMVYPIIVLLISFLISLVMSGMWEFVLGPAFHSVYGGMGFKLPAITQLAFEFLHVIWIFPVVLGVVFLTAVAVIYLPSLRIKYFLRMPAFKEAIIARVAATMTLLLKNGVPLPDAIALAEQLETRTGAAKDLQVWRQNLAAGATKFTQVASKNYMIPPLFVWVVAGAGEDLAAGFGRVAEIYISRAVYRTEAAVYSVMPVASLVLGVIVLSQAMLMISMFLPLVTAMLNLDN